jgi:hypothetical protein
MQDATLPLSGLSPVSGKAVVARFDGGSLSSDAGVLVLREIEARLGVAARLAACIEDRRHPALVVHSLSDLIRFRLMMIAAGYEDGNDATQLRADPAFKMAQGTSPSGRDLASQPTLSRLENAVDLRALLGMGEAMVALYCASVRQVPKRIVLDIDDTFDAVHGGQQLRLFNAHHDGYGFQPIVVFDGEGRFVTAVLRPAKRPKGVEIRAHLRRLVRMIRSHWPRTRILIRADSHYCSPFVLDWCRANGIDFILGLAPTTPLRAHVGTLEASTRARFEAAPGGGKLRRFKECVDGAASWSRGERIIARVEAGEQGTDTRFIVTNLSGSKARTLYQDVYCRRGAAENHILEDPSACRPHILHPGHRQPVPPLPARGRLLADVAAAHRHAEALELAGGPVRHLAPAPDQDRRPHRRAEDPAADPPAERLPGAGHPTPRSRQDPAPPHLSDGA